jgi:hypothetical protein
MVEKLKLYILLCISLILIIASNYMHEYYSLSDSGHFSAGEAFMLGIAGVWKWARLADILTSKAQKKDTDQPPC